MELDGTASKGDWERCEAGVRMTQGDCVRWSRGRVEKSMRPRARRYRGVKSLLYPHRIVFLLVVSSWIANALAARVVSYTVVRYGGRHTRKRVLSFFLLFNHTKPIRFT